MLFCPRGVLFCPKGILLCPKGRHRLKDTFCPITGSVLPAVLSNPTADHVFRLRFSCAACPKVAFSDRRMYINRKCVAQPTECCVCMKSDIAIDHRSRCLNQRLLQLSRCSDCKSRCIDHRLCYPKQPAKDLRLRPPACSRVISEHFSYHKNPISTTSTSYP